MISNNVFKFYLISTFLLGVPYSKSFADEPRNLSLEQCYSLALSKSESLERQSQEIKAAEARYKETISAIYPVIKTSLSERIRNSSSSTNNFIGNDIGGNNFSARSNHSFDTAFNVRQPIFTGFREYYISEANELEIKALGLEQSRNKELLYQDVANIFYQIVYYNEDLKILQKSEKIFKQRIKELGQFIKLGKSRSSEIQAADAELADLGTTKAQVEGILGASKEMLAFLIGIVSSALELKSTPSPFVIKPLEELLAESKKRGDIKATLARTDASGKELIASKREKWPLVYFDGNYYPYQDPDANRDWDMQLKLELPIFDGGAIDSRIEQAEAKHFASSITAKEAERIAEREIRIAYNNVKSSELEVTRLKALLNTTEKNYQAQHQDYEIGVVTNLEVLAAISNVQNSERRLLDAETTLKINKVKLTVSAGAVK